MIRRIVAGTAFAVPVIASFDMSSLGTSSAYANTPNQYKDPAPSFASAATATFTAGIANTFVIQTPGQPLLTVTMTGTLPQGVKFAGNLNTFTDDDTESGTLSGTPAAGTSGSYPLVLTVTDYENRKATQNFTLVVIEGPTFTSANAVTVNQDQAASFTITTHGAPGAMISASSLPPGMTLLPQQSAGTAALGGTPSVAGVYPLTLTAFNGVGSLATQAFTVTVVPSSVFTVSGVKTAKTAAFSFVATVPGVGNITAVLTAPGKKGARTTIATAKGSALGPGPVPLTTVPNKAGNALDDAKKAKLKRAKAESLVLTVTFTPAGGASAVQTVQGLHLK